MSLLEVRSDPLILMSSDAMNEPDFEPYAATDMRRAYEALAATYDSNRGLFDMTPILEDFFARLPPGDGELLDLGCGAGEPVAEAFVERGWLVIGVDFCEAMLALARRHVPHMRRICADIREVAFAPESFSAVTAVYSLFHVPADEHLSLFRRAQTWLRPGGRFLFTYASRDYTQADAFDGWKTFMGQRLYYSHRTPDTLASQLEAAGLECESLQEREIGGERFLWVIARRP
jgi:SAM-dependent methyltransferase